MSPTKNETALLDRRGKASGAMAAVGAAADSEGATRQLFPEGSGLGAALARRLQARWAGIDERWPLGMGTGDLDGYLKALRRWARLRDELTAVLHERGVL